MNAGTTLLTGATSGIGLHLAHQFAAHGHPLILVAPVQAELDALAAELRTSYDIAVETIPADLEDEKSAGDIWDQVHQLGLQVDILANNAGHGFRGKFWEQPLENDLSILRLNIEAVLRLTKLFLPLMISRGHGRIFVTASVAGFEPGPLLNVYHASKAFILSWAEALATELKDTGVKVTILCPGPTDTDFFPKAGMENVYGFQKANLMAPQDVAKAGYKGLVDEDLLVIPGAMNKALVAARRILTEGAQASLNEKFYTEVELGERTRKRGDLENKSSEQV